MLRGHASRWTILSPLPKGTGAPGKELPISRAVARCNSVDVMGTQGSLPPHKGRES